MARRFHRSELVGADLVWLVSIEYAGRAWRWSSGGPIEVDSDDGALQFDGGLDTLEVEDVLDLLDVSPDQLSVGLDLIWPEDLAALVEQGHDLSAASGEVALLIRGQAWESRRVVCTGAVDAPLYDRAGLPASLSIVELPYLDRATWPPPTRRVTPQTWPSSSGDELPYPTVFGAPGRYTSTDGTVATTEGSPAIPVVVSGGTTTKLLIAGHPVVDTTVSILCEAGSFSGSVVEEVDGLGALVSTVDISGASTAIKESGSYWVGWTSGGMPGEPSTAARTGLGDVIEWWLDRSTLRLDRAAWGSIRAELNRYQVAGYVDEEVVPWDFLADNLLELAPISIQSGPDGLYPVLWQWDRPIVLETLDGAAAGVERTERPEYLAAPSDTVSELTLKWAWNDRYGAFRRVTTLLPRRGQSEVDATLDADHLTSAWVAASAQQYGPGRAEVEESDWVADAGTAGLVLAWRGLARGQVGRIVRYDVDPSYGWLGLGDVVELTDADLALEGVPATVHSVRWAPPALGLGLYLLRDPVAGAVSTGPNPTTNYQDHEGN